MLFHIAFYIWITLQEYVRWRGRAQGRERESKGAERTKRDGIEGKREAREREEREDRGRETKHREGDGKL